MTLICPIAIPEPSARYRRHLGWEEAGGFRAGTAVPRTATPAQPDHCLPAAAAHECLRDRPSGRSDGARPPLRLFPHVKGAA
ncbi:hypothetical protein GCM10012280_57100 [Wenjunlia tyrosinilytica]|jgi:hypothetical protein|uniref:Uncharacterized protein n=1 Tax=Wenjunlia tyrosinilytica TaxID=1544741 RepID=A0A917ZWH1_9ACTN|nr:hypothetical protein GCM10012280_57100 [Wenjunlia tyrosinilytica]